MTTDLLDTDYDGIEITAPKRFSNRWQMLFGFTAGKNEGGLGDDGRSVVNNTGYPRQITYNVTRGIFPGLVRSQQRVFAEERGPNRLPNVTLIDIRFSRPIRFGANRSFEPQVDIFNVTNSDVIVGMVNTVGPRLGYPRRSSRRASCGSGSR